MIARQGATTTSGQVSLVERARSGDVGAFELLLETRLQRLVGTARAIVGNDADANDVVQETCIHAWRRLPGLRDVDAFDAWLMRVLVNACRDAIRRRSRVREVSLMPIHDRPGARTDEPVVRDDADLIARAFDSLGPDARALIVLHHLRHEPVASIAAALNIPVGTVKWRLHAARAALEAAIAGEME
jgi:RNA polymerase sigma-70 factor (ECF subfamily)